MTVKTDKDFLEVALLSMALLTMAAVCFGVVRAVMFLDVMEPKLIVTTENVDRTVIAAGATMRNLDLSTRSLTAREDAEQKLINSMVAQLTKLTDNGNVTISKLNDTMDSLHSLIANSDARMGTLTGDADTAIKDVHPVLVSLNGDLVSLKTELDALPLTTQFLNSDLQKLGPVLDNVGTITKNLGHTTGTIDDLVTWAYKKFTAPVSRINAAAHVVARYGVEWFAYHF